MQALILAGGEGTRLRPLTYTVPKPVLPLAGRPHIAYVIDWLVGHGVDDVIVSCGHLAEGCGARSRGARARRPDPLRRGARCARHRRRDPLRGGHAGRAVLRPQRRRALRPRPDRAGRAARAHRRARDDRPLSGRGSDAATGWSTAPRTARSPSSSRSPSPHQIDTDEINAGRLPAGALGPRARSRPTGRSRSSARSSRSWSATASTGSGWRATGSTSGLPERFLEANWDILEGRVETVTAESMDADGAGGRGCEVVRMAPSSGRPCVVGPEVSDRRRRRDRALGAARRLRRGGRRRGRRTASSAPA